MLITWISVFVAFCILVGLIKFISKRSSKAVEIKDNLHYVSRKNVTIFTIECYSCNWNDIALEDSKTPMGEMELQDVEVKWDTLEERGNIIEKFLLCHRCDKCNGKKRIVRQVDYLIK